MAPKLKKIISVSLIQIKCNLYRFSRQVIWNCKFDGAGTKCRSAGNTIGFSGRNAVTDTAGRIRL